MNRSPAIRPCPLPAQASLARYARQGHYTDCYVTEIAGRLSHSDYVFAFYCTWLFRLERLVLRLVSKPSIDAQARDLADGTRDCFAAWSVEERGHGQLLLCDYLGSTRSWLMSEELLDAAPRTRLYFGSAVIGKIDPASGERSMRPPFGLLLPFHKLYSRALLAAARSRLSARLH